MVVKQLDEVKQSVFTQAATIHHQSATIEKLSKMTLEASQELTEKTIEYDRQSATIDKLSKTVLESKQELAKTAEAYQHTKTGLRSQH